MKLYFDNFEKKKKKKKKKERKKKNNASLIPDFQTNV